MKIGTILSRREPAIMETSELYFEFSQAPQTAVLPGVALQPSPKLPPRQGVVLILEDDLIQLRLLEQHLTSVGFEVAQCFYDQTSSSAVDAARNPIGDSRRATSRWLRFRALRTN